MKKAFVISLFLFSFYYVKSQLDDIEKYESLGLIRYTMKDGIAQMQIHCVFQDTKGYIWVGTRGGLSKFNGTTFETFRVSDGLPHSVITGLSEDSKGNIWICTRDGLAKYNGVNIITIPLNTGYASQIQVDDFDRIWILNSTDRILYRIEDNEIQNITQKYSELRDTGIVQIKLKKEGVGLYIKKEGVTPIYLYEENYLKELKDSILGGFVQGKGNEEWILESLSNNKVKLNFATLQNNRKKPKFELIKYQHNFYYYKDTILYHIAKDSIGGILVKTNLNTYESRTFRGIDVNIPSTIFVDDENNIWVGSDDGLIRIPDDSFTNFFSKELQNVWSVLEDDYGDYWFSSYTEGIQRVKNGVLQKFAPEKIDRLRFYMRSIKRESGGLIFPNQQGLLELKDDKLIWLDSCGQDCLSQIVIEDRENNLILSGVKKGVRIIDKKGKVVLVKGKDKIHKNHYIVAIAQDKLGYYWFGSALGLTRYDISKQKAIKHYTLSEGNLPVKGVFSIFKDKKGSLWLGSENGLLLYDYESDTFSKVADLRINTQINSMIGLKSDYLLMGTIEGLFVLNIQLYKSNKAIELFYYNDRNGFMGFEPTKNGMYNDNKGNIWIPCQNHLTKLIPSKLDLEKQRKPIQIQIIQIDERKIVKDTIVSLVNKMDKAIVRCKTVSASSPETPLFAFKLNEKKWSNWSKKNEFHFNHLKHGINTIQVRAKRNIYSLTVSEIKSIQLKANLSLTQRYSFLIPYFIAIIFLGIIIFLCYRYRIEKRSRRETKRIKELLRTYQLRSLEARMNPHFIFNSISTVQKHIHLSDKESADNYLVMFSNMLRYFFETFTKEKKTTAKTLYDEVKLKDEIEFIKLYVKLQQELYDDFEVVFKVDDNINLDQSILPMVIQPFVENAITHGLIDRKNKNILKIEFKDNNGLTCIVEDNGVGISMEKLDIPFEKFILSSNNSQLLKERIAMLKSIGLHIDINVKSEKNKGTKITLQFKKDSNDKGSNS